MKQLNKVNMSIYWIDFILSSILFCASFYFVYSLGNIIAFIIASIFLYRICAFTHEIAHQNKNPEMARFKLIWNLTAGLLMLQPSIKFTIPHLKHHTTGIFGTKKDPQYPLIFSNFKLAAIIFIILPWVLPLYNLLVCGLPKHKKLLNIMYKQVKFTYEETVEAESYELYYLVMVAFAIGLLPNLIIPFYLVSVSAWFLSVLRIPLEHPLNIYIETSTSEDQKILSKTHESPIYIFLQPLGLRYHKAHHMYPKVPYHNLCNYHYELKSKDAYSTFSLVP